MSVESAQTTRGDTLSVEAALDDLLDKILEQLKQIDLFSSCDRPIIFPVYAHDNPVAGNSRASCVIRIIKWLEAAGCRIISDRNPLLPHCDPAENNASIRNILSNQFRLLPHDDSREPARVSAWANKVIVFSSEVLRHYLVAAPARELIESIAEAYKESQGRSRDHLEHRLRLAVEEKARSGSSWFHHVLTEIAFLKLRKDMDNWNHGIIPVALDGELPNYLPFVGPTDLVLKLESVSLYSSDLHGAFLKLLLQIYPEQHMYIEKFKACYLTLKGSLEGSSGVVIRDRFDADVTNNINRAHMSILQQLQSSTRITSREEEIRRRIKEKTQEPPCDTTTNHTQRRNEFLGELATLSYSDKKDRNPERSEGTCEWFTSHSLFKEWRENDRIGLLWLSADPGCGKSVLARYLVDEVLLATRSRLTCYFFFNEDFADQRSIEGALRCLLRQIFDQDPSLLDMELVSDLKRDKQLLSSRAELWEILVNVVQSRPTRKIICILDGFDECSSADRIFLMQNLERLYMSEIRSSLKVLLTSRPYEDIERGLRKMQNRRLTIRLSGESEREMEKISLEIDVFVRESIADLCERYMLSLMDREFLFRKLTKFENRTYLWVSLMINMLHERLQTSPSTLRTTFEQIPRSVSAAYEKILRREQRGGTIARARRLLHIIIAANRPLSPGEIAMAFTMDKQQPFHDEWTSRNTNVIRRLSGLLVVIRNDKAFLAHQTVKEFLVQQPRVSLASSNPQIDTEWEHSFDLSESHRILGESCLSYLEQSTPSNNIFLDYAANNWAKHLRATNHINAKSLARRSSNLCDSISKHFSPWAASYWKRSYFGESPVSSTALIVASLLGLPETVDLLLDDMKQDLDAKDNIFDPSAFFWACAMRRVQVVELLLNWISTWKPNLGHQCIDSVNYLGQTPLHFAVEQSNLDILDLLLRNGANTSIQDCFGQTPFHLAVAEGNGPAMKLIIDSGADINVRDQSDQTPLHLAVLKRRSTALDLLLDSGANVNVQDRTGMTPLHLAVSIKNGTAAKRLLRAGADLTLQSHKGQTALHLAVGSISSENVARLLIETGAAVEIPDLVGFTPIYLAARNFQKGLVQLMLDCRSKKEICDSRFMKLHMAAFVGDKMMYETFLDTEIDALDFTGRTALMWAIEGGDQAAVEWLLQRNADANLICKIRKDDIKHHNPPDNQPEIAMTPLSYAVKLQNASIVEGLLSHGADPNVDLSHIHLDPPLSEAMKLGASRIVELLKYRGAKEVLVDEKSSFLMSTGRPYGHGRKLTPERDLENRWQRANIWMSSLQLHRRA